MESKYRIGQHIICDEFGEGTCIGVFQVLMYSTEGCVPFLYAFKDNDGVVYYAPDFCVRDEI